MTNLYQSTGLLCKLSNTSVHCKDEAFTVVYYQTEILKYWPENGFISLNTGGFENKTTKDRMNKALSAIGLDAYVFQYKRDFYCRLTTEKAHYELKFIDGVCEFNRFTGERMA